MTSQGTEVFVQTLLGEKVLPESWYNIVPDLSFELAPPLPPTFEAGALQISPSPRAPPTRGPPSP